MFAKLQSSFDDRLQCRVIKITLSRPTIFHSFIHELEGNTDINQRCFVTVFCKILKTHTPNTYKKKKLRKNSNETNQNNKVEERTNEQTEKNKLVDSHKLRVHSTVCC